MGGSSLEGTSYDVLRGIDGKLVKTPVTIPKLGPRDVLIRLTHSGVCYTDYELWSLGLKLALGHEGVGIIEEIGADVTTLKVGDRVGGGFHRDSCGKCKYCKTGRDILCHDRVEYIHNDHDNGTFAPWYIGKETHVHLIPEGMPSEVAAPLQCAGATVYAALTSAHVKHSDRVGVIGVGGLGHMAIQFAAKMGCDVVVFSNSKGKEEEAKSFGAAEFVPLDTPEKVSAPVDFLLVTAPTYPDWAKFTKKEVIARDGTIMTFSVPVHGPISLPAFPLFWENYHLRSSLVSSTQQHREMLDFAHRHGIAPKLQLYDFKGVETMEQIFDDLKNQKVKYRAVVKL